MIPQGTARVPQTPRFPQGTAYVPQGTARFPQIVLGSIAENAGAYTSVGTLSLTSLGNIVTWSLTNDASGTFVLGGPKNDQVMLGWTQLDYSVTSSYVVTARASVTNGVSGTTTTQDFTYLILVTQSNNPSNTSNTPYLGLDFRHNVTTSSGSITSMTQSWSATGGTVTGVASNQPTLVNEGPCLQPYCKVAANQYMTFTSTGALSAFDFYIVFGGTSNGVSAITLIAKNSSTASFIQLQKSSSGYDRCVVRNDAGTSKTIQMNSNQPQPGSIYLLRFKFDGTNFVIYKNGTQLASDATFSGTTFTFSQLFRVNTVAASWTGYVGAVALYSAVQSAGDVTTLTAWFTPWRQQRRFTANAGSDSTVTPWLQSTPYQTIAASGNTTEIYYGDTVLLNRGDVFTGDPFTPFSTAGLSDATQLPPRLGAYGSGAAPIVQGVAAYGSTWTIGSSSGGVTSWTGALTTDPTVGWIRTGDSSTQATRFGATGNPYLYQTLTETAGGAAYTIQWAGGTVTLYLPDGMDPNTYEIRLPQAAANAIGLGTAGAAWFVTDVVTQFWQSFGCRHAGTVTGAKFARVTSQCNYDDGFGPNTGSDYYYVQAFRNGAGGHSSGKGDGWSPHGTAVCSIYAYWLENNDVGGIRPEQYVTTTADRGFVKANYNDVQILNQGSGSSGGALTITNTAVVVTSASETGIAIEYITGVPPETTNTLLAYNNTLVNATGSAGSTIGIRMATGAANGHEAKWNIISGFNGGISVGTLGLTEDYNDFNCNVNLSGSGIVSGGHSFSANPLFAETTSYTLQSGSPSLRTAVGSTQTLDMDGRQRPKVTTPNIGAQEYA